MIVRFDPTASPQDRGAVAEALEALEVDFQELEEILLLGRALAEDEAVRVAAMRGVAAVTPADAATLTRREDLLRWFAAACLVVGALVLAASHLPVGLGPPADPLRTPGDLLPAWPMLAWNALVDRAPAGFPVPLLILAACLALLAWPFLAGRLAERRPAVHAAIGVAALLAGVGLALLGLRP